MKRGNTIKKSAFISRPCLIVALILISTSAWANEGVVVVTAMQHFDAANAGIEPGDVLLSWSRGTARGLITSPVDLMKVEIEESPLGAVTIKGSHQSRERSWELGQEDWGITTQPEFAPGPLQLYLRGRRLAENGGVSQAFAIWGTFALTDIRQSWLYAWCAEDGADLVAQKKRWRTADLLYRKALAETTGEPLAQVFLLRSWAVTFEERDNWDIAGRLLRRSLAESEAYDPKGFVAASALSELARLAFWRFDFSTAHQLYHRALAIDQTLAPQSLATARTLISLAQESINENDPQSAQVFLEEAKPILERVSPNGPDYAMYEDRLGSLMKDRGDFVLAKRYLDRAKDILENRRPDSLDMAYVLTTVSFVSSQQGDVSDAELQARRALMIYEKTPVNPSLGYSLTNVLGVIAYKRRDLETAEKYAEKTELFIRKLAPNSKAHAGCLINSGLYALDDGHLYESERHWQKGLAIVEKVAPGTTEHAEILEGLTEVAISLGDFDRAEQYAMRAQEILAKVGPEGANLGDVLAELADISQHRGNFRQAEYYIRHALSIFDKVQPESSNYAEGTARFASILRMEGQTDLAEKEYGQAIMMFESDIEKLGGDSAARSDFRASYASIYSEYVALLVQQGKMDKAFEVAERARARTLLELLSVANVDVRQNVDPSLLAEERKLREEFSTESDHRIRLLMGEHSDEELRSSDARKTVLLEKFANVEFRIRMANPRYAHLIQPDPITIKDVQQSLLDSTTLLLEYSLGEKHSYLWLISSQFASVYTLPSEKRIDTAAQAAYKELANLRLTTSKSSAAASSQRSLGLLSGMLLGPVEHQLGRQRLLIIADGELNYIPFSALPIPDDVSGSQLPLVSKHEVINLPSASVLLTLRQEHQGRQEPPRAVAVLADPIFDSNDPRLGSARPIKQTTDAALTTGDAKVFETLRSIELTRTRWTRALGHNPEKAIDLPRLIYSRDEAQEIVATAPAGESLEALDFRASRTAALDPALAQYKVVHFATHGLLDTSHPEFSGLIFSLYNEKGDPEIGLLSLEDIYNLHLPVDMVVLSACETALGKDSKGEGLIGLARGFMYAGASRVVASLWRVNDIATAKLMASFYQAIERDHLPAAAALRKAQLEMSHSKHWANPYYWAGFELQGEWN